MEIFPARTLFILLLILISSVSCHKKNCVVLPGDIPISTIEGNWYQILLLGDISLSTPNCYNYLLKDIPDGEYGLGLYIWPNEEHWKPDDSWRKLRVKMIETNTTGEHWVDHSWDLLELYQSRNYGFKDNTSQPFLFFYPGDYMCIVEWNRPLVDLGSCTMISRFSPEPLTTDVECYYRHEYYSHYHDSIFEAKNSDAHQLFISIKGHCPKNIRPEAKLGLIRLGAKIKSN